MFHEGSNEIQKNLQLTLLVCESKVFTINMTDSGTSGSREVLILIALACLLKFTEVSDRHCI